MNEMASRGFSETTTHNSTNVSTKLIRIVRPYACSRSALIVPMAASTKSTNQVVVLTS